jgi:hypothetical protein
MFNTIGKFTYLIFLIFLALLAYWFIQGKDNFDQRLDAKQDIIKDKQKHAVRNIHLFDGPPLSEQEIADFKINPDINATFLVSNIKQLKNKDFILDGKIQQKLISPIGMTASSNIAMNLNFNTQTSIDTRFSHLTENCKVIGKAFADPITYDISFSFNQLVCKSKPNERIY